MAAMTPDEAATEVIAMAWYAALNDYPQFAVGPWHLFDAAGKDQYRVQARAARRAYEAYRATLSPEEKRCL